MNGINALEYNKETNECIICRDKSYKYRTFDEYSLVPYSMFKCESCGHGMVLPQASKTDLIKYYNKGYFKSESPKDKGYGDYKNDRDNFIKTFNRRLKRVKPYIPNSGKIIEIGCAYGYFLEVIKDKYDYIGIDIVPFAKDNINLETSKVMCRDLMECNFDKGSFDIAFMWDVIEHLVEPREYIRYLYNILREGGCVVILTQDFDSMAEKLMGKRWEMYKNDEHLYHFTRQSISILLEQEGFRVSYITKKDVGKYINKEFVYERLKLFVPDSLELLRRLITYLMPSRFYATLRDEFVVVAEKGKKAKGY